MGAVQMGLGQVRMWLRVLGKFAAYVAGFWAAFRFIFDFSNAQAFGLGLTISIAIDLAASRKGSASTFRPYMWGIYPYIGRMLIDLGLVTDEEFKAISKDVPPYQPWSNKHMFHYPIRAFVISCEPDTKAEVIHYPELGYYSTRLYVDIRIEPFKLVVRSYEWTPELFIKGSFGGYSFGIRVHEEWWKENKARVAAGVVLEEDHEYNFGRVRLMLAILPYLVMNEFYIPPAPGHEDRVKEVVAKHGWTNESRGGGEIPYYGEDYEHKYVKVWTNDLE